MLQDTLANILLNLLNIDSTTKNELQITLFIKHLLQTSNKFKLTQVGKTLIYTSVPETSQLTLALYGHTDTVTNQQEFKPCVKDSMIYGCGASDMKAGLAVMLKIMSDHSKCKSNFNLQFIFYDAEEGPYIENGLARTLEEVPTLKNANLALVLEPTLNAIHTGCLGSINADIIVKGKSCHSARPWEGENPIYKALPLLYKISKFKPTSFAIKELEFIESMSITKINAGTAKNIIPAEVKANINYRFSPLRDLEDAQKFLLDFLIPTSEIEVLIQDKSPSGQVVTENTLLKDFKKKYALQFMPKQAWTDIARLNSVGIDAVNFGPGNPAMAHQKNETVSVIDLEKCYTILTDFIFSK